MTARRTDHGVANYKRNKEINSSPKKMGKKFRRVHPSREKMGRKVPIWYPHYVQKTTINSSSETSGFPAYAPGANIIQTFLETLRRENACPGTVQNSEDVRGGLPLALANGPVKAPEDVGNARGFASRGSETLDHLCTRTYTQGFFYPHPH